MKLWPIGAALVVSALLGACELFEEKDGCDDCISIALQLSFSDSTGARLAEPPAFLVVRPGGDSVRYQRGTGSGGFLLVEGDSLFQVIGPPGAYRVELQPRNGSVLAMDPIVVPFAGRRQCDQARTQARDYALIMRAEAASALAKALPAPASCGGS